MDGPHNNLLFVIESTQVCCFISFLSLGTLPCTVLQDLPLQLHTLDVCVRAQDYIDSWAGLNPPSHRSVTERKRMILLKTWIGLIWGLFWVNQEVYIYCNRSLPQNLLVISQFKKVNQIQFPTPTTPLSPRDNRELERAAQGSTVICEFRWFCEMFPLPRRMAGEGLASVSPAFAFLCNYGKCIQCARVSLLSCCFIISLWDNVDFSNEMQI